MRIGTTVYKFAKSRAIEGIIKTVTIKRDALGELYVYFSCLVAPQPLSRVMTGKSAGFDFGLTTYLTGSGGSERHAPQPFKQALTQVAQAHRQLARKVKGSHNRKRALQASGPGAAARGPGATGVSLGVSPRAVPAV